MESGGFDTAPAAGRSREAATHAIETTALTRMIIPAGNFLVAPALILAVERLQLIDFVRRPAMIFPVQAIVSIAVFASVIPPVLALFAPVECLEVRDLRLAEFATPGEDAEATVPGAHRVLFSKGL